MKKAIWLLLLVSNLSWGANVTQAQAQAAQKGSQDLLQATQALLSYSAYVNSLFISGFQLSVAQSTITVAMTTAVQNQYINVQYYQLLKQRVVDAFDELP